MKQLTQRLRDGRLEVLQVPAPELSPAGVLVDVRASLVSTGTERSKLDAARKGLVGKARARPDQARKVLEKARRDGIAETFQAVRLQLDSPSAIGYSAAGVVVAVGGRVRDLLPGQRVACGGEGAVHAELDHVSANLCVPVPDEVGFDHAAFATVGAIALHGVRQADARVGERVAVIGLGLVGQLTCQILRAAGCRVTGIDLSARLVEKALVLGGADAAYERSALADHELPAALAGVDAVVVTAATPSADPVHLAALACRDRGRIVIVGDVGLSFERTLLYQKEIELRMSRSYGPGRYDTEYEERGLDYPIGYVRWTERRNMSSFLDLLATQAVDVDGLIGERVPLEKAASVYEGLLTSADSPLGIVIEYAPIQKAAKSQRPAPAAPSSPSAPASAVGVVGAGSFAQRVLIPGLHHAGFELVGISSASGLSARGAAERFGFARAETTDELLEADDIGLVAIATPHVSHAELAERALRAGKAVFVEKPPGVTLEELRKLRAARAETGLPLMVGFNRTFAPLARRFRDHVRAKAGPIELVYRVNAGYLPTDHWQNDLDVGGGRLVGEACHFVDFACWLVGTLPERVLCSIPSHDGPLASTQSFVVGMTFANGSCATVIYGARGAPTLAKEYVEAHAAGSSAVLTDFSRLELYSGGSRGCRRLRSKPDKGHRAQFEFLRALVQGGPITSLHDQVGSMEVTLAALAAAEQGGAVALPLDRRLYDSTPAPADPS